MRNVCRHSLPPSALCRRNDPPGPNLASAMNVLPNASNVITTSRVYGLASSFPNESSLKVTGGNGSKLCRPSPTVCLTCIGQAVTLRTSRHLRFDKFVPLGLGAGGGWNAYATAVLLESSHTDQDRIRCKLQLFRTISISQLLFIQHSPV